MQIELQPVRKVKIVTDHWLQVIDVQIPSLDRVNLRHQIPHCNAIQGLTECRVTRSILSFYDAQFIR